MNNTTKKLNVRFYSKYDDDENGYVSINGVDKIEFKWNDFYNNASEIFIALRNIVGLEQINIGYIDHDGSDIVRHCASIVSNCVKYGICFNINYTSGEVLYGPVHNEELDIELTKVKII